MNELPVPFEGFFTFYQSFLTLAETILNIPQYQQELLKRFRDGRSLNGPILFSTGAAVYEVTFEIYEKKALTVQRETDKYITKIIAGLVEKSFFIAFEETNLENGKTVTLHNSLNACRKIDMFSQSVKPLDTNLTDGAGI